MPTIMNRENVSTNFFTSRLFAGMIFMGILIVAGGCRGHRRTPSSSASDTDTVTAAMVKNEFRHAWRGYMRYAAGYDALRPLSKKGKNWYRRSLLMTPVDAFDTMVLMGLEKEQKEAKKLIFDSLTFDVDMEVQLFEVTIRLLGGLLSAYQWDGDERFLALAEELGKRLLPAFRSPTGMPYRMVNLRTGAVRDKVNNPAEIGTLILEFGTLSRLTGDTAYYHAARRALLALYDRRSPLGLVGSAIDVETGEWKNPTSHIGGGIDSYLEYLLKAYLLFGDPQYLRMYRESVRAVNRYLADTVGGYLWYGQADMYTGERTSTYYGALEAFFPGVLLLGGDTSRAAALQRSGFKMWQMTGIEPEKIDYRKGGITSPAYLLRPENIESAWYLWHATGERQYRLMGETFFRSIRDYCRTGSGYAYLTDVRNKTKGDDMESFFLAETLKYLYLLFAPDDLVDTGQVVFNTEAHPLRKVSPRSF